MKRYARSGIVFLFLLALYCLWTLVLKTGTNDVLLIRQSISNVCYYYNKNIVAGNLCNSICRPRGVVVEQCLSCSTQYKVFRGKMRISGAESVQSVLIKNYFDVRGFDKPISQTSQEDLRLMVLSHLQLKFGDRPYSTIATSILNLADQDYDGEVSLPEARTMFALLESNDFLMTVALSGNEKVPRLLGFCGDVYVTEGPPIKNFHQAVLNPGFFDERYPWPKKAQIAIGLLEFIADIQDTVLGDLLLCSIGQSDIGVTGQYEVTFFSLEWLTAETAVANSWDGRRCLADQDCQYGPSCGSRCDRGTCSERVTLTNLQQACRLLRDTLQIGAPPLYLPQLDGMLDQCTGLDPVSEAFHLQHSLLINHLKNSLWNEISS